MPDDSDMVPRTELERAVAEAVATEQRKHRVLQLVLISTIIISLIVGGVTSGVFGWQMAQLQYELQEKEQEMKILQQEMRKTRETK
jgi:hypothetical protein